MNKPKSDLSQRQAALITGFGILIMILFVAFSLSFVFPKLIVPEDPASTVNNILKEGLLLRSGICSLIVVIILDVLVAWSLYVFFKPVHRSLSLLAAWLRLGYAVIFTAALFQYFDILRLLSGADHLKIFNMDQLQAKVMLSINAFNDGWAVGFVFFGLHLALLGILVFKSGAIPKILGILLAAAGLSYLIDKFGQFLSPGYDLNISVILGWGELIFVFWLLFRGGKAKLTALEE